MSLLVQFVAAFEEGLKERVKTHPEWKETEIEYGDNDYWDEKIEALVFQEILTNLFRS